MAFGDGGFEELHGIILTFLFCSCCVFIYEMITDWILTEEMYPLPISIVITGVLFYLFRNFVEFKNPRD